MSEKIEIDCYPWAAPTLEQRNWFDALPAEEQLRLIQQALDDGLNSGISDKSVDEIFNEARAKALENSK